jgi:hypothetical protein
MIGWKSGLAAGIVMMTGSGCAQAGSGARVAPGAESGVAAITAEGLLHDIRELASDRFLGRAAHRHHVARGGPRAGRRPDPSPAPAR